MMSRFSTGWAAWLGVAARIEAPSHKLKRQNPEPLEHKLTNPDAVHDGLARLDRFNLSRTPNFEPRRGPTVRGPVRLCGPAPLAYLSMPGAPDPGVLNWMEQIDGGHPLQADFTAQGWRAWQRAHPRRSVFTVLHHPLVRAHEVYLRQVVHGQRANVRAYICRVCTACTCPRKTRWTGMTQAMHRAGFLAFLRFVAANLNGQTAIKVLPAWASQTKVIEGVTGQAPLHHLLHVDELSRDLPGLGRDLRLDLPGFTPVEQPRRFTLGMIHDPEVAAAGRAAYALDYEALGFEDWAG